MKTELPKCLFRKVLSGALVSHANGYAELQCRLRDECLNTIQQSKTARRNTLAILHEEFQR